MRAIIVLAIASGLIAGSAGTQAGPVYRSSPVQQYNAGCLDYAITGCNLAR